MKKEKSNSSSEFENKSNLGSPNLYCQLCDKKIKTKWYLEKHMKRFHGEQSKVPWNRKNKQKFQCIVCEKKFKFFVNLKKHALSEHKIKTLINVRKDDDILSVQEKSDKKNIQWCAISVL